MGNTYTKKKMLFIRSSNFTRCPVFLFAKSGALAGSTMTACWQGSRGVERREGTQPGTGGQGEDQGQAVCPGGADENLRLRLRKMTELVRQRKEEERRASCVKGQSRTQCGVIQ